MREKNGNIFHGIFYFKRLEESGAHIHINGVEVTYPNKSPIAKVSYF